MPWEGVGEGSPSPLAFSYQIVLSHARHLEGSADLSSCDLDFRVFECLEHGLAWILSDWTLDSHAFAFLEHELAWM